MRLGACAPGCTQHAMACMTALCMQYNLCMRCFSHVPCRMRCLQLVAGLSFGALYAGSAYLINVRTQACLPAHACHYVSTRTLPCFYDMLSCSLCSCSACYAALPWHFSLADM